MRSLMCCFRATLQPSQQVVMTCMAAYFWRQSPPATIWLRCENSVGTMVFPSKNK